MIILHGSTPLELLKTAMLRKIYNCPVLHEEQAHGSLYAGKAINASSLSFNEVTNGYEKTSGPLPWLKTGKLKALLRSAYYAVRFNAQDRFHLVILTFSQALDNGPDFVISRVSKEARLMYNRSRQVSAEFHRACGFVRLIPVASGNNNVMVGKVEFRHDVADLVLNHFKRRTNNGHIYLVDQDHAYYFQQGKLTISHIHELPFPLPKDDFSEIWEAYYDSQYIKERKNLALARKHLPKKYWSWVPEGKKLN